MLDNGAVDLGSVHIHKKVIGDIAASALKEVQGVELASFGIIGGLFELFGYKNYPGVSVSVDPDGDISLNLRLQVEYGTNIPLVAQHIQELVRAAVEKAVDIELKEINVNIQSVERTAASAAVTASNLKKYSQEGT